MKEGRTGTNLKAILVKNKYSKKPIIENATIFSVIILVKLISILQENLNINIIITTIDQTIIFATNTLLNNPLLRVSTTLFGLENISDNCFFGINFTILLFFNRLILEPKLAFTILLISVLKVSVLNLLIYNLKNKDKKVNKIALCNAMLTINSGFLIISNIYI